jgi:hypothetical protein
MINPIGPFQALEEFELLPGTTDESHFDLQRVGGRSGQQFLLKKVPLRGISK